MKRIVVIVDDDKINNYLCELMIKTYSPGMETRSFTNPEEALEKLSPSNIDPETIILLDLKMPQMNAWQFIEKFEEKNLKCSVFILTSSINPIDKLDANKYPQIEGFFLKPLSLDNLNSLMKTKAEV